MIYVSKTIALTFFLFAAACTDSAPSSKSDSGTGTGSGSGAAGVSEKYCGRLDTCNALAGSLEECIEKLDQVVDGLTKSERADFELLLNGCLALQQCDAFLSCVVD
jgi:hypothetical protein